MNNNKQIQKLVKEILIEEGWLDRLKAKAGSVGSSDKEQAMAQSRVKGLRKKASELLDYLMDTERLMPGDSPVKKKLKAIETNTQNLIANIDDFASGRELGAPVADPARQQPDQTQVPAAPQQPTIQPPSGPKDRTGGRVGVNQKNRDRMKDLMGIGAKDRSGNRIRSKGIQKQPVSQAQEPELDPKKKVIKPEQPTSPTQRSAQHQLAPTNTDFNPNDIPWNDQTQRMQKLAGIPQKTEPVTKPKPAAPEPESKPQAPKPEPASVEPATTSEPKPKNKKSNIKMTKPQRESIIGLEGFDEKGRIEDPQKAYDSIVQKASELSHKDKQALKKLRAVADKLAEKFGIEPVAVEPQPKPAKSKKAKKDSKENSSKKGSSNKTSKPPESTSNEPAEPASEPVSNKPADPSQNVKDKIAFQKQQNKDKKKSEPKGKIDLETLKDQLGEFHTLKAATKKLGLSDSEIKKAFEDADLPSIEYKKYLKSRDKNAPKKRISSDIMNRNATILRKSNKSKKSQQPHGIQDDDNEDEDSKEGQPSSQDLEDDKLFTNESRKKLTKKMIEEVINKVLRSNRR